MASLHLSVSPGTSVRNPDGYVLTQPFDIKHIWAGIRDRLSGTRDSAAEIRRVLARAADDRHFLASLSANGSRALGEYDLSSEAKAALVSGDVNWVEDHIGKLDDQLGVWFECRLQQESW